MADTIFTIKHDHGKTYLTVGSDWRYQLDSSDYVWDSDGRNKIGYLKEEWWHGERWYKVIANGQQGWVKK